MVDTSQANYAQYLKGSGEMGRLTREFDWAGTVIGSPDTWSQSLLTAVSIILNSRFPMFLWWGADLIQFYNDAYRPSLGNDGKHPKALGQRGEDCWQEIWPVIEPLINQVMAGGESTWSEDQLIPIYRNNRLEDVYWTFSYSPVIDETGKCAGVLVTCNETTDKVKSFNALKDAKQQLERAQAETEMQRDRLKQFFMQAPEGICVLGGPDMVYELVNPAYQAILPGRDLLGNPVAVALPELKDGPIYELLNKVYQTGVPFEGKEIHISVARYDGAALEDRYFNFSYLPRRDESGKVDGIMVYVFEVTDMVFSKRLVEESEKQFRFMLNAIPQQVWTARPDGMIDYVNQVVSDDFGQNASEIIGEGWRAFIHPDDLPDCLRAWEIALKTEHEYMVEFRLLIKDGSYKWHLARALPLLEDGKIKLWIGTNTNIDLQKTNEQRKDEFLSIASHELKTPLTSLKASIQIIQKIIKTDLTSEKLPLFMDKASNNLNKMLYLMEDLMNVSKIQQGQLALNKTRINLVDLVNDCCEHIRMGAAHELVVMGDKELFIDADYRRIDQVVVNLINNAVKYSPLSNRIEITVEHDADNAKVSVRDFGIGVSPEKLPHLFDRYFRVDSSGVQYSGLGLGLYISAEIVRRHNGNIGVESEFNEGSTFWFTLPMD